MTTNTTSGQAASQLPRDLCANCTGGCADGEDCSGQAAHASDCAVHNGPAYPAEPCDCGAIQTSGALAAGITYNAPISGPVLNFYKFKAEDGPITFTQNVNQPVLSVTNEGEFIWHENAAAILDDNSQWDYPSAGSIRAITRLLWTTTHPAPQPSAETAPAAPGYWTSQKKMIERAIIGLRDGWATRKDADDALAALAAAPATPAVAADEWAEAERISDLPLVHETLQDFAHDPTGDNGVMIVREVMRALAAQPAPAPLDMILHCPNCGKQHVDEPDERTPDWSNPPHRSHLCHCCGHIWRPADVPTNGVQAIKTKGSNDSPAPAPLNGQQEAAEVVGWQNRVFPPQIVEGKNPPDSTDKWVPLVYAYESLPAPLNSVSEQVNEVEEFEAAMRALGYPEESFNGFYAEGKLTYYDKTTNCMLDAWQARAAMTATPSSQKGTGNADV